MLRFYILSLHLNDDIKLNVISKNNKESTQLG